MTTATTPYTVEPYGPHWLLIIDGACQPFVSQVDAEHEGKRLADRAAHPPIAWTRPVETGLYPIPTGAQPTTCASCGASIVWTRTHQGKAVPLSLATGREVRGRRVALSHFQDCPDAQDWSH
jgi:hypothetical protein